MARQGQSGDLTVSGATGGRSKVWVHMLAARFDLWQVRDQVGHDDPTTTLATCGTISPRTEREPATDKPTCGTRT
jgi:hypothetical protein